MTREDLRLSIQALERNGLPKVQGIYLQNAIETRHELDNRREWLEGKVNQKFRKQALALYDRA
jgi:hypothetical protein